MNLIDDKDTVTTNLGRDTHLVNQIADTVNTRIRCGIEFVDVETASLVETLARLALATSLVIHGVGAVDSLCKDTGASSLSYTARTAKKVGVSQPTCCNRIFQSRKLYQAG